MDDRIFPFANISGVAFLIVPKMWGISHIALVALIKKSYLHASIILILIRIRKSCLLPFIQICTYFFLLGDKVIVANLILVNFYLL